MTVISDFITMVSELPWNGILLGINAASCATSATMIGTYQRKGAKHKRLGGVMALFLLVACGSVTILIGTGYYGRANLPETIINVMLCISLITSRGNVMRIFKPTRQDDAN